MNEGMDKEQQTRMFLKHLQEQLDEIKKERENLAAIIKKIATANNFEDADDIEKQRLEVLKQEVDEHSKIAVEHLKYLEEHLEEAKKQYLEMLNQRY